MEKINNLKKIRELYGATQEQIAKAINVNRVTITNWENGNRPASSSSQEKLSLYYGIGPEYFYEKELDAKAKEMIIQTAQREKEVVAQSNGTRNKEEELAKLIDSLDYKTALKRYMYSTKILLAVVDKADLDTLKTTVLVNKKLGERLEWILEKRKQESNSEGPSLFDLLNEPDLIK